MFDSILTVASCEAGGIYCIGWLCWLHAPDMLFPAILHSSIRLHGPTSQLHHSKHCSPEAYENNIVQNSAWLRRATYIPVVLRFWPWLNADPQSEGLIWLPCVHGSDSGGRIRNHCWHQVLVGNTWSHVGNHEFTSDESSDSVLFYPLQLKMWLEYGTAVSSARHQI